MRSSRRRSLLRWDEVGLDEIESVDLVDLEGRRSGGEATATPPGSDRRADELCNSLPPDVVEGLEHEERRGPDHILSPCW
jgi:hypothetical protein